MIEIWQMRKGSRIGQALSTISRKRRVERGEIKVNVRKDYTFEKLVATLKDRDQRNDDSCNEVICALVN